MAKREQGYVVTVKMFVPVNAKDINDTKAKADAIFQAQQNNNMSGLSAAGADIMKVDHRWTSREKAEQAVTHEAAESVEEIAEQAKQTDVEDVDDGKTDADHTGETIEEEQARIRAEHDAREAEAEAEEHRTASVGEQQAEAVEEVASGGTSGRRRRS